MNMKNPNVESAGPPLIGVSKNIQKIRELINHIADTGLNILISGETGAGKEVVAQNLYAQSNRNNRPFLKVNCAALPEGLLESELYGHERGAFTGAERRKKGKFELADGGVLFLDEIGDMSLSLQSKLLHVLQSGVFAPLGSERDVKTDTWILAATNHDLEVEIREKKFREDLFYRLNTIKIHIEPLRNRREDIPELIDYYLHKYEAKYPNKTIVRPTDGEIENLTHYPWPGNVRELQNVLKRILVIDSWQEIIQALPRAPQVSARVEAPEPSTVIAPDVPSQDQQIASFVEGFFRKNQTENIDLSSFSLKSIKKKAVDQIEREIISYVLDKTNWNRSKASKILKISYKTLLYKITDLKITPPNRSGGDFF